jgi:tRNA-splicing ligase RtcB
MSRAAAKRAVVGHELRQQLESRGIVIRCPSNAELAEEAPLAYKDVERVVDVVHAVGIARKVARLRPLGVVKG